MNKDLTEIICILDRSGSMQSMKDEAINGFNRFIEEQKSLPGEAKITIALFDDQYELLADGISIKEVMPLNDTTFVPRGMTAMNDAIGKTINTVGERIAKASDEERPGKVIVVILTDGMENASQEFDGKRVKEMVEAQKKDSDWQFIFLASGIDVRATASSIGIHPMYTMGNADPRAFSMNMAYSTVSKTVASYRSTGNLDGIVTEEDED